MPVLNIKVEVIDSTLDKIEDKLGLGTYDVIEELEIAAKARYMELRKEALK